MGEQRFVRQVAGDRPDTAVDAALAAVDLHERAGFRLEDYHWSARVVGGSSALELEFAGSEGIAPPVLAPPARVQRDDPTRGPKRWTLVLLAVAIAIPFIFAYLRSEAERQEWEFLCSIPEFALDYPEQCR